MLDSGVYLVKELGGKEKHSYLIITNTPNGAFYQINGGVMQYLREDTFEGSYEVLGRLRRPLDIKLVRLNLEWRDSEGHEFETSMTDIQLLRNLFQSYPELAKTFGSKKI
ncbi:hypothetical protein [Fulvivirga lutimaris]|uniref:hypothetical protein n=1 Tax=Fulvivirga lutimaris TaxID=1819566 RepID=UPI0012BCA250|nr:hypothetical protein [Fulvivirga lutimaris]MTI38272.1 hypothetical protein [Fulvivirga lutimaris]